MRNTNTDERTHRVLSGVWSVARTVLIWLLAAAMVAVGIWAGVSFVKERFLAPAGTDNTDYVLVEIPRGAGKSTIANLLEQGELIRSKTVFKLYVDIFGYASKLKAGSYILNPTMSYRDILDKISKGDGSGTVTNFITIEGTTVEGMAQRLQADGHIGDTREFTDLASDAESFKGIGVIAEMLEQVPEEKLAQRRYALEGYLFPAKYEIYVTATAEDIARKMAVQMNSVFNEARRQRAYELGMTVDEVITLASVIEKEGKPADFARISAVFHNRLAKGMRLQSCATVQYALGIKRIALTSADTASLSPYNTYACDGLPVGPICAPSEKAINAALYPDESYLADGYLYFVTKDPVSGELEFNKDKDAHEAAAEKYRPLWEAWDRENGN